MTLLNVLLQIQATGAAAADTLNQVADSAIQAAPQTVEMSYWEMAKKGGPFIMIPMLIMSFIAVYIFIERWVAIKKASKEDTTFMDRIKDYIMDGTYFFDTDLHLTTEGAEIRTKKIAEDILAWQGTEGGTP